MNVDDLRALLHASPWALIGLAVAVVILLLGLVLVTFMIFDFDRFKRVIRLGTRAAEHVEAVKTGHPLPPSMDTISEPTPVKLPPGVGLKKPKQGSRTR